MSLSISVYSLDPTTGKEAQEIVLPAGEDLAGFETWRTEVYGSEKARTVGVRRLASLRSGNVDAAGPAIEEIKRETMVLLEHATEIAKVLEKDCGKLKARFSNISKACDLAIEHQGKLRIW